MSDVCETCSGIGGHGDPYTDHWHWCPDCDLHQQYLDRNSGSRVKASDIGEDLKELALSLGFAWPDDEEGRWRCLKSMAGMASHWRAEVNKYSTELRRNVEKENLYGHQQRRLLAMTSKVSNLRKALKQFMVCQIACMRELKAEVQNARAVE